MKIQLPVLLFTLCCFLMSCGEDKEVSSRLSEAERLMNSMPDSSLLILQQIEPSGKLTDRQYALWCLLLTQAHDKNYIEHTSDSLIQIAVSYFEKENDILYIAKAYYYNAAVWHDLNDSSRAQHFYLKALEACKNSNDYALLGLIYSNLGSIYIYQNLLSTALDFEKKAITNFSLVKDSTNIGLTLRDIGRIYSTNKQIDSAIIYYSEALSFLTPLNRSSIYNELGSLYRISGQYKEAFSYINLALATLDKGDNEIPIYHNLGYLYRLTGQPDSAIYYLSQCINSSNVHAKSGAYLALAYLEKDRKNWEASINYLDKHIYLQDSIDNQELTERLQQIQSSYSYQQVEIEKEYHKTEAQKKTIYLYRMVIIFTSICVILIGLFLYLYWNKKKQLQQLEKQLRIQELKQVQNRKAIQLDEDILSLFKTDELYQKFFKEKTTIDKDEWEALEEWIEKIFPSLIFRIRMLYPAIDLSELRLCCLIKIDIPVKQIAKALCLSSTGISQKKKRLYGKLTGKQGGANDLNIFLSEI